MLIVCLNSWYKIETQQTLVLYSTLHYNLHTRQHDMLITLWALEPYFPGSNPDHIITILESWVCHLTPLSLFFSSVTWSNSIIYLIGSFLRLKQPNSCNNAGKGAWHSKLKRNQDDWWQNNDMFVLNVRETSNETSYFTFSHILNLGSEVL